MLRTSFFALAITALLSGCSSQPVSTPTQVDSS
ncbi:MAG: hypothetical protein ACJAU3_001936, partial [Zhongshania sp.]